MARLPKKDYYHLLDLAPDASPKQIRDAYRRRVTACHPDKFQDPDQKARAEEAVKQLNQAYETLRDADLRAAYDRRRVRRPAARRQPPVQAQPTRVSFYQRPHRSPLQARPASMGGAGVVPLDTAYPAFPTRTRPPAAPLHYVFTARRGDHLQVFLEQRANLILLDERGYARYRAGLDFDYLGGYARSSPAVLQIPFSARWHLILESAGDPGPVRAAVRLLTSA